MTILFGQDGMHPSSSWKICSPVIRRKQIGLAWVFFKKKYWATYFPKELVHEHLALFIYLFMFRGPWACTWAGFMWEPPFQLIMGFSIGPSSVGCMLSTSGKCVPSFKKNVFRTINSMRYVQYRALNDRTVQRLPKHCVCRSNNTFIQPTDEIYYWLYIENSSSNNQGWGCNRSSKQARRVKTQLSLPNQTSAIITKGLPKKNKCMHQTK